MTASARPGSQEVHLLLGSAAIRAIEEKHLATGANLMERAGIAAANTARDMLRAAKRHPARVLVLAGPGNNGGVFYRKVGALKAFDQGSHLAEYCNGLEPQPGELLLLKQYASAFFGTSLAATLTSQQIDTVIITGVSTSGCVRATALDACQYGFIPFVVRDAVGDRDPRPHEANLFDLQAKYAEVVSEAQILTHLKNLGRT